MHAISHGTAIEPEIPLRSGEEHVPAHLEAALILPEQGGPYPGLFIFTQAARMMRPVRQCATDAIELIGTLEQVSVYKCV